MTIAIQYQSAHSAIHHAYLDAIQRKRVIRMVTTKRMNLLSTIVAPVQSMSIAARTLQVGQETSHKTVGAVEAMPS